MKRMGMAALITAAWIAISAAAHAQRAAPGGVTADGHDLRIDVTWDFPMPAGVIGYHVYRAERADGPFQRLTESPQDFAVYSDYLGLNEIERHYRVTAVASDGSESDPGATVSARARSMSLDELLTSIQLAHFRYFWHFGHPVSGLAREGFQHGREICTSGGTGFGMMTIVVGAERGFVSREAAAENILKQVRFLQDVTPRYHGMWAHWIHGETGATIPFSGEKDNGGDVVESAFLVQGMLTAAQYFDRDTPVEREIRERVEQLWREMDWDWYRGDPKGMKLVWHWSPDYGFEKNHRIGGHFNECMIAYILGLSSPTHPLPVESYEQGWIAPRREGEPPYHNGNEYFGIRQPVGWPMGGPLFFTHYSFIGLDPRYVTDRYTNYFENNRAITLINRAYCIENPKGFKGYSDKVWGLTASFTPGGYHAHEPRSDRGTITPTAALSAMPYAPDESIATLEHFYREMGREIWGHLGFRDAFNPSKDWVSDTFLAIDQGPIGPMIENYRTQLCWKLFMRNADVVNGLKRAGLYAEKPAELPYGGATR